MNPGQGSIYIVHGVVKNSLIEKHGVDSITRAYVRKIMDYVMENTGVHITEDDITIAIYDREEIMADPRCKFLRNKRPWVGIVLLKEGMEA